MQIEIKNLKLRTIVGINDWEREKKQDIVINICLEFDASAAILSDDIKDTVDYKGITKNVIEVVEHSRFFLLEKLADTVLRTVMDDKRVLRVHIEVDKPQALRFTDSVSIKASAQR